MGYASISTDANGKVTIFRRSKLGSTSNQYKITRTYYRHSASPDFSRIIVTIYGKPIKLIGAFIM